MGGSESEVVSLDINPEWSTFVPGSPDFFAVWRGL